jgi:hypothetical protein
VAKKSRARKGSASGPTPPPFVPPPFGVMGVPQFPPAVLDARRVVRSSEGWSEYKLDDGTVLKIRSVLVDVKRAKDQYGIDGKPTYFMTLTNVTEATTPARLMRPTPKNIGARKRRRHK